MLEKRTMVYRKKRRKFKEEDWDIYPWPDPRPGQKYGPTPMQKQLFIYHWEPWERPHFHGVDVVLMIGGRGSGKSYRKGTPVLRFDGSISNIEDIKIGDLLMGPDSSPREVLDLGRGREVFYKVIPVKGEPFYCNESHILALKRVGNQAKEYRVNRTGSVYVKPPRYGGDTYVNVSVKEYLTWSKRKKANYVLYRTGELTFPSTFKPPIDPYLFGMWLGDGSSADMTITTVDQESINFLKSKGFKDRTALNKPHIHVLCNNKLHKLLKDLNVKNNKHIPLGYKTLPIDKRLQLLAGIIDTDGHYQNRGHFEITQKNKQLAEDILFLCRSLGLAAYLKEVQKSCPTRTGKFTGTYYRINISGDLDKIPTRLPRKKATPRKQIKDVLVTGFSLERLEEDEYYGVVLDKDHLFVLGDFTVVHNSLACIAEIIELTTAYPKCAAVVGGVDMPLLKRNVMDLFGERLSYTDEDGITEPWGHPMVLKAPPDKTPIAPLVNGSTIRFLNIGEALKVRGFTADIFMIEEVNLLDASSLKEMYGRSRGRALPIRQFILNMNPTGARDWVYDLFGLKQYEKDYVGPPIQAGEVCTCQFCNSCEDNDLGQWAWEGGEKKIGPNGKFYEWTGATCSNPNCANIALTTVYDKDGNVKKLGTRARKDTTCPGNQSYYRVIRSASFDNPHNPSDFVQLQRGAMSEEEFATFVKGEIVDLNTGLIYKEFSSANISDVEFDPHLDIMWTMDFNKDPMCSQICQETSTGLNVVDEFTLWNATEREVAEAFCERYKDYKGVVHLYGDPNGITTNSRADSNKTSFKFIYDYLKMKKFNVQIAMKKIKGQTLIPIVTRVNNLKAIIKNVEGVRRLFVNPKCKNLIESLRNTRWREKGTPHEDENCDAYAKINPKRYTSAVLMTHPQAALGYLVSKRFPMIKETSGIRLLDTDTKTVVAHGDDFKVTSKEPQKPIYETKKEEPWSISSMIGGISRNNLNERLAIEKAQEEARRQYEYDKEKQLKEMFGG